MTFYEVDDVMAMLGISKSKAYKIMQALNNELKENGYITIAGKVPKQYFDERLYNNEEKHTTKKKKTNSRLKIAK